MNKKGDPVKNNFDFLLKSLKLSNILTLEMPSLVRAKLPF
jgi:hypothetical protein